MRDRRRPPVLRAAVFVMYVCACRSEKVAPPASTPERAAASGPETTSAGAPPTTELRAETAPPGDTSVPARTDPWADSRRRGVDFRAVGEEPGWYLEISEGQRVVVVADYGDRRATLPAPEVTTDSAAGRTTYHVRTDAHSLDVVAEDRECHDAMSGVAYPQTVTMTFDGRSYRGCGRAP